MSEDLRFPIVLDRLLYCHGKCQRYTYHKCVVYPDKESSTCKTCLHPSIVHYDRPAAVVYTDVDKTELEGIMQDLNELAGKISVRKFGNIGKKDRAFIDYARDQILAIRRRVDRLKEREG